MSEIHIRHPLADKDWEELTGFLNGTRKLFSEPQLASVREAHPLNPSQDRREAYSASAEFLFKCATCAEIADFNPWYNLILDTIGGTPFLRQHTDADELINGKTGSNLARKLPGDETEYRSSAAHHLKGRGYICDHCKLCNEEE